MPSHGDSYSFAAIDKLQLYGLYISILQLECINHAGKQLGAATCGLVGIGEERALLFVQMMQSVDACTGQLKPTTANTITQ